MDATTTFDNLLTDTDLAKGLLRRDVNMKYPARESHLLQWGHDKIGAEAVFVQHSPTNSCVPLIYFRRLEEPDPSAIAEAQKLAWNMGQAPLLFVVLPGEVRVYSTYEAPRTKKDTGKLDDEACLIDKIEYLGHATSLRNKLAKYKREELLSGRFWEKNRQRFDPKNKVEGTLLANLAEIRKKLMGDRRLNAQLVHRLLGRSIFIKYLQDRKDRNGKNVFPEGYFEEYRPGAKNFIDILSDKKVTYRFFQGLAEKFNGDLFPVEPQEERAVSKEDLSFLSDFLAGSSQLSTGQQALWQYYAFDAIPIEFISNLYETFFHYEKDEAKEKKKKDRDKAGTYYTPHRLVEFVMDEVFPWDGTDTDIRFFDPACGSGIFLVEAYRRLIARWQQANPEQKIASADLKKLLTKNLYGLDSNPEATKVAAFSLYLTMCDYLEPRYIWNNVEFPRLTGKNLLACDFFDIKESPLAKERFDIVVGNPPWESKISDAASKYVNSKSLRVGDKQIAQAFLWGVTEICKDDGEIALIAPSKGLLFNMSRPNKSFRKEFFSSFEVKTVVNFSALRQTLFAKAVGPAAAIFYRPQKSAAPKRILYCSPKPCYSPEDNWHFVVEPQDIAYIPVEQAASNEYIWKAAMWGTPRDWELIQKLSQLPTLGNVCDSRNWVAGEGFIEGNKAEAASWLTNKPYVTSEALQAYAIVEDELPKLQKVRFERPRKGKKQIYEGPHLLIEQSPKISRGIVAALLREYAVFSDAIVGISAPPSDEEILGAICTAVNNIIPRYHAMLTSSRWLIERDNLTKAEIMSFPIPQEIVDGKVQYAYDKLRQLSKDSEMAKRLESKIISMYGLTQNEMALIYDTLGYTLDSFYKRVNSDAVKPPTEKILKEYGELLCQILSESFGQRKFNVTILAGDMPMILAQIAFNGGHGKAPVTLKNSATELMDSIKALDQALLNKGLRSLFIHKNVRIYEKDVICIIKRNQRRFWTKSNALRDADETYTEIMKKFLGN